MTTGSVVLRISGLGHVPSFKNSKMIARGRLITSPKRQKWMENCIRDFESQLHSMSQTTAGETQTAHSQQSWIASSLPEDDCWQWVPQESIAVEKVEKGREGATVTIERIN